LAEVLQMAIGEGHGPADEPEREHAAAPIE
jgi:hypothetical protein